MHNEIERKFLFKGSIRDFVDIILGSTAINIEDYYFNKYTRYRWIDDKCWVGIKGEGTLNRTEEENMLAVAPTKEDYTPRLIKSRHKVSFCGHIFEINVYKDFDFVVVEVELENINEELILPDWCGEEVTHNLNYYNYNLWGELNKRYGRDNTISENSKNKFVN